MSEKLEQIKQLQKDLFVEEHGITKEQARKLNEFIFYEPTGKEFSSWAGYETLKPSVRTLISGLQYDIQEQNKQLSNLEWEHKKLWFGSILFGLITITIAAAVVFSHIKG